MGTDHADRAGLGFYWKYAPLLYDYHLCIEPCWTDAVFTAKRMQAMIVTNNPDKVIAKIHKNCTAEQPWSTMQKEPIIMRKAVLDMVITRKQSLMWF